LLNPLKGLFKFYFQSKPLVIEKKRQHSRLAKKRKVLEDDDFDDLPLFKEECEDEEEDWTDIDTNSEELLLQEITDSESVATVSNAKLLKGALETVQVVDPTGQSHSFPKETFKCGECHLACVSILALARHTTKNHKSIDGRQECPACDDIFVDVEGLRAHIRLHHKPKCLMCNKQVANLNYHYLQVHPPGKN
jgi:hypothetical protein